MSEQSIGGEGAQDGIRGTPSGTQGGDSGQGIGQGGQSQQSSQGHSAGWPGHQGGIRNNDTPQLDPQEENRDKYGKQQTGATSGEVGDHGNRQSGMQGTPGDAGHDIADLGNKQSSSGGPRGGTEDQR